MATLLTGAGYIGAALLRRLPATAAPVVVLENFFSTSRDAVLAALPSGTRLIEGDVANKVDVARAFDQLGNSSNATVFHLAAQPSAAVAQRDPEITERSNLVGARILLEAAKERNANVVFAGSFRVYGDELQNQRVDEQTAYGRVGDLSHLSKVYVEQLARMLELPFVSVRLGVTYGLSPIMKTTPQFMTVPNLFCMRAASGEAMRVLEDRPMAFVHVADAADALLEAATCMKHGWRVVNAAPEVASIGEVARTVEELMRERGRSVRIEGALGMTSKFAVRSQLKFEPRWTLKTGLSEVLDYFMAMQV